MKITDIKKVNPLKFYVVTKVLPTESTENELYEGQVLTTAKQVKLYTGETIKVGPEATNKEFCPELAEGDITIFSEFAGSYISTGDENLYKLINGYDIMAITSDAKDMNEATLTPTADRLLVSVIKLSQDDSGMYLTEEDLKDPRLLDLSYGKIIKKGSTCKEGGLEIGTVIAYDPYAGESVRSAGLEGTPELRVIREADALLTL